MSHFHRKTFFIITTYYVFSAHFGLVISLNGVFVGFVIYCGRVNIIGLFCCANSFPTAVTAFTINYVARSFFLLFPFNFCTLACGVCFLKFWGLYGRNYFINEGNLYVIIIKKSAEVIGHGI